MNQFNPYNRYQPQSSLDWIMVQTVDQVEAVAVQPNTKAWIMVQNEPIFALRTSDSMGLTKTEYYKFEKYEPHPAPEFVTKEELVQILKELKEEGRESTTTKRSASNKPADA